MHRVVAAAIYRGAEVLLCHRAPTRRWYPNVWDFPGGHVGDDEPPEVALVREIDEELALDLSSHDVAALPRFELVDDDLHLTIWRISSWTGDPVNTAADEHDEIRWFHLDDALTLPLAHPKYRVLLRTFAVHPKLLEDGGDS